MSLPNIIDNITTSDYILVVQDDCFKRISIEDFLKDSLLGGFSICEAVYNCWEDMGVFPDDTPKENTDTPPTFRDVQFNLMNRQQNFAVLSDAFYNNYYDAEGDLFKKIVITGGDLTGITYKGQPINIGLVINVENLAELAFSAKDVDSAYQQTVEIEVYDEKNIKAV